MEQCGWFVWTQIHGKIGYRKYSTAYDHKSEMKKYHDSIEVKRFPLTEAEWELPLDTLALKYPLPNGASK